MRSSLHSGNDKPSVFGDFVFMETKIEYWKNLDLQDLPNEIWKDIPKYEGAYAVSSLGRVKSLERYVNRRGGGFNLNKAHIMKQKKSRAYLSVALCCHGKRFETGVHRYVGLALIPNPLNLPQINHKDFDGRHNVVDNLEWGTALYNINYTISHGRRSVVGECNVKSILKEKDVLYIRNHYTEYGKKRDVLAKMFKISESTLGKVIRRETWRHL